MKKETLEEFINSQPYYGSCTTEYLEGIEVGTKWQEEQELYFVHWLMDNCELAEDGSLWIYESEEYSVEGLFKIYEQNKKK